MRLVLATRNAHKIDEIGAALAPHGVELVGLDQYPAIPDELPETGDTFEANALQKAAYVYERTGVPCLADDSGLEVDALGGAPGIHSKRFSPTADAAGNNALLLERLGDRPDRAARFRCVLAVVGLGAPLLLDGRCEGHIGHAPRGAHGFGYDPLFWPADAPGRALAELTMDEKNAISHRGRAVAALIARLPGLDRPA